MDKVEKTINTLKALFKKSYIINSGLSGKDSAVLTHCAVEALKQAYEEDSGCRGVLHISTTNTSIDNFEIHNFIMKLHKAARDYAEEYDLPIHTKEVKPQLLSLPFYDYIGKGKLLRTMQTAARGRDCTVDWKITPAKQHLRELSEKYQTENIVSISGTRDSESVSRANNIAKRGESIDVIVKTDLGLTLAPIKDWTTNDVWGLIGKIENDEVESFIDIHAVELRRHYSAGNGGTCDIYFGDNKSNSKSCGSRFGCTLCSLVKEDRSLQNQIELQPEIYGYMQPFVDLRKFLNDTVFDLERSRSLIGRKVLNGSWVKVGFNQYSLDYRKELLRYVLTIDSNEQMEAERLGIAPRFQLIGYDLLVAIQFAWAREGSEPVPAEAIRIWHEVHTSGKRYAIPETSSVDYERQALNFGSLSYIGGAERHEYRYVDLNNLSELFDTKFNGLIADDLDREVFPCHQTVLDGRLQYVTPFKESKRNRIDPYLAEQYVNEIYFDLEAGGAFDSCNELCPTFIVKDLLFNEVFTIRKGGMNRLHQDLKRAQVYSAIGSAKRTGSAGIIDSIVLAHSVAESEFNTITTDASNDADEVQMALGF